MGKLHIEITVKVRTLEQWADTTCVAEAAEIWALVNAHKKGEDLTKSLEVLSMLQARKKEYGITPEHMRAAYARPLSTRIRAFFERTTSIRYM